MHSVFTWQAPNGQKLYLWQMIPDIMVHAENITYKINQLYIKTDKQRAVYRIKNNTYSYNMFLIRILSLKKHVCKLLNQIYSEHVAHNQINIQE